MVDRVLRIVLSLSLFFYFSKCKNDIFHLSFFFPREKLESNVKKNFSPISFPPIGPISSMKFKIWSISEITAINYIKDGVIILFSSYLASERKLQRDSPHVAIRAEGAERGQSADGQRGPGGEDRPWAEGGGGQVEILARGKGKSPLLLESRYFSRGSLLSLPSPPFCEIKHEKRVSFPESIVKSYLLAVKQT